MILRSPNSQLMCSAAVFQCYCRATLI